MISVRERSTGVALISVRERSTGVALVSECYSGTVVHVYPPFSLRTGKITNFWATKVGKKKGGTLRLHTTQFLTGSVCTVA